MDLFLSNLFGVSNHRKIEIELCPVCGIIPRGWLGNKTKGNHEMKSEKVQVRLRRSRRIIAEQFSYKHLTPMGSHRKINCCKILSGCQTTERFGKKLAPSAVKNPGGG